MIELAHFLLATGRVGVAVDQLGQTTEGGIALLASESQLLPVKALIVMAAGCLNAIMFDQLNEEWLPGVDDELVGMWSAFSRQPGRITEMADPIAQDLIARSIVAAGNLDAETLSLAFFRVSQINLQNGLFVDCIRYYFL